MPVHQEVFSSDIKINLPDVSGIIKSLRSIEIAALKTVSGIENAFSNININISGADDSTKNIVDIEDAARRLGTVLRSLESVGVKGGLSSLVAQESTELKFTITDLARQVGVSVPQIISSFESMAADIAGSTGKLSEADFARNVIPGLRRMLEVIEETNDGIIDSTKDMSYEMVGGSIIPDMVTAINAELGKIPIGARPSLEKLRDAFVSSLADVQKAADELKRAQSAGDPAAISAGLVRLKQASDALAPSLLAVERAIGQKLLLSTRDVADALGTTTDRVRQLVNDGRLVGQKIGGRFQILSTSVNEYTASIIDATAQTSKFSTAEQAIKRLGISWEQLNSLVEQGALKTKDGLISSASLQKVESALEQAGISADNFGRLLDENVNRFKIFDGELVALAPSLAGVEAGLLRGDDAASNFEKRMTGMVRSSRSLRDGIALIKGGEGLLGLREILVGSSTQTTLFSKALDLASAASARLSGNQTRAQVALKRNLDDMQANAINTRNAVDSLKDYGASVGIARSRLNQFSESIRQTMLASRDSYIAYETSGEITERNVSIMENANRVARQQIDIFRENNALVIATDATLRSYLDTLEDDITLREQQVRTINGFNKVVRQQNKEAEESGEKQRGVFSKISQSIKTATGSMNLFSKEADESEKSTSSLSSTVQKATAPLRNLGSSMSGAASAVSKVKVSVDLATSSMLRMVGIVSIANIATDTFQSGIRKATGLITKFKDEFLGFGVVKNLLGQIAEGTVEFSAEVRQSEAAIQQMGKSIAESVGSDSVKFMDFLSAKAVALQEQGVAIATSFELIKSSLAIGFEIGGLDEAPEKLLKVNASLKDLSDAFANQEIGLQTISRAAQNWTAIYGGSSSELAEKFIQASTRMSTEILEVNGLAKNASTLVQEWADANGRLVSSMTDTEKQQAVLLGIINQTNVAAGAYEAAMGGASAETKAAEAAFKAGEIGLSEYLKILGTSEVQVGSVGKQLGSLQRYVDNARLAFGDLFLPVLGSLANQLKGLLKVITDLAGSEAMQKLAQSISGLVSTFTIANPVIIFVIDNFNAIAGAVTHLIDAISALRGGDVKGALDGFKNFAIDALTGIALFVDQMIGNALNWGFNLVAEFASGIAEAAQSVLVSAANVIGDVISWFLAPGSPPERGALSNIDKWGTGLMNVLGANMTAAAPSAMSEVSESIGGVMTGAFRNLDIGSLESVKSALSPLRQIFQSMVSEGTLDETALIPNIQETRELLVELYNTFEDTGEISQDTLDSISSKFGEAGQDVRDYLELQLKLKQAQEALNAVNSEVESAQQAGFVSSALKGRQTAAQKEVEALQEQLDLKKAQMEFEQEGRDLAVQQLELLKRIAEQGAQSAKSGVSGQRDQWEAFLERNEEESRLLDQRRDLGLITEEEYQRGRLALEKSYIDTALKLNKPISQERVNAFIALQSQVKALSGGGKASVGGLEKQVGGLNKTTIDAMSNSVSGLDETKKAIGGVTKEFAAMRQKVEGVFQSVGGLFSKATGFAQDVVRKIAGAFQWLYDVLVGHSIIPDLINAIKEIMIGLGKFVLNVFKEVVSGTGIGRLADAIVGTFQVILENARGTVETIGRVFKALGSGKQSRPFSETLANMGKAVGDAIDGMLAIVATFAKAIQEISKRFLSPFGNLIVGIAKAIRVFIDEFSQMESLAVVAGKAMTVLKALGVVVGIIAFALSSLFVGIVNGIGYALEPAAKAFAAIVDIIATLLIPVLDLVVTPLEVLWALLNERPQDAVKAIEKMVVDAGDALMVLVSRFPEFIQEVVNMVIGFGVGLARGMSQAILGVDVFGGLNDQVIGLALSLGTGLIAWKQYGGAISGAINSVKMLAQVNLIELRDSVARVGISMLDTASSIKSGFISVISSAASGVQSAGRAMVTFATSPVSTLQSAFVLLQTKATAALAAIKASTLLTGGVVVAAIVSWGVALKKFNDLMDAVADGVDKATDASQNWANRSTAAVRAGENLADVMRDGAEAANEARREFDKNVVAGLVASGKDIEIYTARMHDAEQVARDTAATWNEYDAAIKEWNNTVSNDSLKIMNSLTEEEFKSMLWTEMLNNETSRLGETMKQAGFDTGSMSGSLSEASAASKEMARDVNASASELARFSRAATEGIESAAAATAVQKASEAQDRITQAVIAGMGRGSDAISRALGERSAARESYESQRIALIENFNAEVAEAEAAGDTLRVQQLREKHAEELAEIDMRYSEESVKRKQAIGEALLDLNDQILKEKLLTAELTDAAEIEQFHRQRAEMIAALYDVDFAQRYTSAAADALTAMTLTSDQANIITGESTEFMLLALDKLRTEGYDALSARQQEMVIQSSVLNAQWLADNGATTDQVVASLGAVPVGFQQMILDMLAQKAPLDEIMAAINTVGQADVTAKVGVDIAYTKEAGEAFEFQSPKTKLQHALEDLSTFADETVINVQVAITDGALESVDLLGVGMENVSETSVLMRDAISDVSLEVSQIFSELSDGVVGPAGSMTRMISSIGRLFSSLSSSYGFLGRFKETVISIFDSLGVQATEALGRGLGNMDVVIRDIFGISGPDGTGVLGDMFRYGYQMMVDMADGIASGASLVASAVQQAVSDIPDLPGKDFRSIDFSRAGLGAGVAVSEARAGASNYFAEGSVTLVFPNVESVEDIQDALENWANSVAFSSTMLATGM